MATDHPIPAAHVTSGELQRRFGARWTITGDSTRGLWSAEHRSADGRQRRYIVARSPGELALKLDTAEQEPSC
jgi:hypothetical protein